MNVDKINCTVEILTRNSAQTLKRCLESVKDFAEIIVLDGNSTDATRAIAEKYGCKIVKQYSTDDPDVAIKNYAEVRNKGLKLASHDWFMFIDSDEYLSREAVEEIRAIVSDPKPEAYVWWQPRKYTLDDTLIECATTYPNRQIRFFHRDYVEGFIKPVHERVRVKNGVFISWLKGVEYVPMESVERLRERWARYMQKEEEALGNVSSQKLIRLASHSLGLFLLYSIRYVRNLFICGGKRMPFTYEFARHFYLLRLAYRLSKKALAESIENLFTDKNLWGPLGFVILVTVFSFFGLLGYSVFNADQFFYFPSLFQKLFPGELAGDFMANSSPAAFTLFDETILGTIKVTGLDLFWSILLLEFLTRSLFFFALYKIIRYFTQDTLFSLLSLFVFISGFVVYGTGMRAMADMLLARDMALSILLFSLFLLLEKKFLWSSLLLGLAATINPSTAVPFALIFYVLRFYFFISGRERITPLNLVTLLVPVVSVLVLKFFSPAGFALGIFTILDPEWYGTILKRTPNIFVTTWYYPNSSPLYLAASIYFYYLLKRELGAIFSDFQKKIILPLIFWIPAGLTVLSVVGGEVLGLAFILQLQLSRSLILWKLVFNALLVFYAYRHVLSRPRDFFYNFSLVGITASFIASEKVMLVFLPVQILIWVCRNTQIKSFSKVSEKVTVFAAAAIFISSLPVLFYFAGLHHTKDFFNFTLIISLISLLGAGVIYVLNGRFSLPALIPLSILVMLGGMALNFSSFSYYPREIFGNREFMAACVWLQEHTAKPELLLADPFSGQGGDLRLACLKNVFVTKKDGGAGMFSREFALEWRKRFDLATAALKNPDILKDLAANYGVSYVFAEKNVDLFYPLVYENSKYRIYSLK